MASSVIWITDKFPGLLRTFEKTWHESTSASIITLLVIMGLIMKVSHLIIAKRLLLCCLSFN